MIKGVTHAHLGPIWYHSEPSDVPYSLNQFLGWDFFAVSYSKPALEELRYSPKGWENGNINVSLLSKLIYKAKFLQLINFFHAPISFPEQLLSN